MKKGTFKILTLCCIFAALSFTACDKGATTSESTQPSETSISSSESTDVASKEESTNIASKEESISSSDESTTENTTPESTESEESTEQSSEIVESSINDFPYTSDDESIEESFHQHSEYTDNENFNTLFAQNALDLSYQNAIADAPESQMASITAQYVAYWKIEVENAYNALADTTDSNLDAEKEEWNAEADAKTQEIYDTAKSEGGSLAVLSAYAEVMNLYKAKAAQLYEQVYALTGSFSLAYAE
ncbi:MAG: hypothetical protein ACI4M3_00190 [Acutalibacteraceae bacterium]